MYGLLHLRAQAAKEEKEGGVVTTSASYGPRGQEGGGRRSRNPFLRLRAQGVEEEGAVVTPFCCLGPKGPRRRKVKS